MTFYRRNLPHWHPEGASIFLTWRLFGSLPVSLQVSRGTANPGCALPAKEPGNTARIGCATNPQDSPGKRFKLLDAALDKATKGPFWLKDSRIARSVTHAIYTGESVLGFYVLHAFVVMPNHVHLLIMPKVALARITNGMKGVSARDANSILGRKGKHFWQDESFDHWVRTSKEFDRIRTYIEHNPVSAGLTTQPQDWPWSSARPKPPSL